MSRRLRRTVYVDGVAHPSGSTPPADIASRITNPAVWDSGEATVVAGDAQRSPATTPPTDTTPTEGIDVSDFHTGAGWYQIPGVEGKVRGEDNARAAHIAQRQ